MEKLLIAGKTCHANISAPKQCLKLCASGTVRVVAVVGEDLGKCAQLKIVFVPAANM